MNKLGTQQRTILKKCWTRLSLGFDEYGDTHIMTINNMDNFPSMNKLRLIAVGKGEGIESLTEIRQIAIDSLLQEARVKNTTALQGRAEQVKSHEGPIIE
jgi:hypothetical protein